MKATSNNHGTIRHNGLILTAKSVSHFWKNTDYNVYWEGLVFVSGIPSGIESVKVFVAQLEKKGIENVCSILKGIYFFVIQSRKNDRIHAFIDNSGLYQAFHTSDKISTSFLELAAQERHASADLDPDAVVEFLHFGSLYSGKTYLPSIRRISYKDIICLSPGVARLVFTEKNIAGISASADISSKSFEQHFHEIAASLSNCKVSVDLTGGLDTRLVAAMLDHCGLQFETASSGGTPEYEDIHLSKGVAQAMGHPWFSTIHSASALQNDLNDLLLSTDGLYDILYYHRLYQLQNSRKERGIDTMISGVGGELFKDYWWLHDFPFYSRKASNVEKFVNMRIMSFNPIEGILENNFADAGRNLKSNLVRMFSHFTLDSNTKTYDNIVYNIIMSNIAGRILTSHSCHVKCYAPFLDPDLARIGFNLPRKQRFYNLFHRKELTRINPLLAELSTSENGMSASYRLTHMVRDVPRYLEEKIRRILIKLNMAKRTTSLTLNDPCFHHYVRNMKDMRDSFNALRNYGIVRPDAQLDQLEDKYLGAFLTLGMVVDRLGGKSSL